MTRPPMHNVRVAARLPSARECRYSQAVDRRVVPCSSSSRTDAATHESSSAIAKLDALRAAREQSEKAILLVKDEEIKIHRRNALSERHLLDIESSASPSAPRTVDIRMYEGLAASRNRLSKKVSELHKLNRLVTEQLNEKDDALVEAFDCLSRSATEFANLTKLAQGAAAGVQFGVDREQALNKILKLQERLELMVEVVRESQSKLGERVVREVPIVWYGLASEVRLMGDFDGWTTGHLLSSEGVDDSVFGRFEATVQLTPGRYKVKFLVDGQWRLAQGWPTEDTPDGDTNNILIVENTVYEPELSLLAADSAAAGS